MEAEVFFFILFEMAQVFVPITERSLECFSPENIHFHEINKERKVHTHVKHSHDVTDEQQAHVNGRVIHEPCLIFLAWGDVLQEGQRTGGVERGDRDGERAEGKGRERKGGRKVTCMF